MDRFERTRLLLGHGAMARLASAHVLVAGLGAVGSYAVEALARSGVGTLTVVDFDEIHKTNFNRQLFALESTLGMKKIDAAAARIRDINPTCRIFPRDVFLDDTTLPDILACRPDVVIDAIDSLNSKAATIAHARKSGIPVISSMGAATRTDPSTVRVADVSETFSCPLARLMRKRLKKRGIHKNVRCVFSTEPPYQGESRPTQSPIGVLESFHRGRPRHVLGSFSCLTGIFGLMAAREALWILIKSNPSTENLGDETA